MPTGRGITSIMTAIEFGTDGIRGVAGVDITLDMIYQVSAAAAEEMAFWGGVAVVGHDPRLSSPELAEAACAGLASRGVDVFSVGMTTTPAIGYLTELSQAQIGVVISASHNPMDQNGIKLLGAGGRKVADETEARIARLANRGLDSPSITGKIFAKPEMIGLYEKHVLDTADVSLNGLTVVMDTAHGAASELAPRLYEKLGAKVIGLFAPADGNLINKNCGATHTTPMRQALADTAADVGIAYDGDADRALMASPGIDPVLGPQGFELSGDDMMYIIARQNQLAGLVTTIMTNSGIELSLSRAGVAMHRVNVGDRYVAEGMQHSGYQLGGEDSGHVIDAMLDPRTGNRPYLAMGDGIHTSLLVLRSVLASGRTMEEWRQEVEASRFPMERTNVIVQDKKAVLASTEVQEAIAAANAELGTDGRVVLRPSGTESKFRILVEARDKATAAQINSRLTDLIQGGFGIRE
jgi:phosphoglucosamine mutase